MSGEHEGAPQLRGISKYLNSVTYKGKRNWVLVTYASLALGFMYLKSGSKKKQ